MDKEAIEEFKKRHLRQNKEIVRVNSMQSFRIRELEQENKKLLDEILELREKNIHYEMHGRKETTRNYIESVEATKWAMENKVRELRELVKHLGRRGPELGQRSNSKLVDKRARRSSSLHSPQSIDVNNSPQLSRRDEDVHDERRRINFDSPSHQVTPPLETHDQQPPFWSLNSPNFIPEEEENTCNLPLASTPSEVGIESIRQVSHKIPVLVEPSLHDRYTNSPYEEEHQNKQSQEQNEARRTALQPKSNNFAVQQEHNKSQDHLESRRPSRPRKQVNYALPSLRAKMRRDGDKSDQVESERRMVRSLSSPKVSIKEEPTEGRPSFTEDDEYEHKSSSSSRRKSAIHKPIKREDDVAAELSFPSQDLESAQSRRRTILNGESIYHGDNDQHRRRRRSMLV